MRFIVAVLGWSIFLGIGNCLEGGDSDVLCDENEAFSEIQTWWQKMSIQKPLNQCKTPREWIIDSPLLKMFSNQVPVSSFACGPGNVHFLYLKNS